MDEIIEALADQFDELRSLTSGLDAGGWALASRCDGWTLSDVVLHLAQTNEWGTVGPHAGHHQTGRNLDPHL